jgi:hypothetical protein
VAALRHQLPCPTCLWFHAAFLLAPERLRVRRTLALLHPLHAARHEGDPPPKDRKWWRD